MDSNYRRSKFETLLKPAVDDAGRKANAKVLSAALDLRNSAFRIVIDEKTTIRQRTSLRDSVRQQILRFYRYAKKLRVHVRLALARIVYERSSENEVSCRVESAASTK